MGRGKDMHARVVKLPEDVSPQGLTFLLNNIYQVVHIISKGVILTACLIV